MKTMLVPILAIAAALSSALPALALEQKDSADFKYKYEMETSPEAQDVDGGGFGDFSGMGTAITLGTGVDIGTILIDASTNGKFINSAEDVGKVGDGWHSMAPSSSTGFTVEARVKVTACTGNNGAICIEAGPSDSKVYARLNLFGNKIGWNGTDLATIDTSKWHTYRITREGGKAVHSVYVDGVLVAENLGTGFTYNDKTLYRMLLGSPGGGWTGKAQVAYIRFTTGAYAPVPADRVTKLSSSDFDYKYEMLALPSAEDLDASGATDFTVNGSNWLTLGTGDDTGTASMTINGTQYLLSDKASGTAGDVWKNLGLTAEDSAYTIETRLKITACTGTKGALLLNASYGVANENSWLQFYSDKIAWNDTKIADVTASDWHTYRLVAEDNQYWVYVDGELVSGDDPLGNGFTYSTALNRLLFGGNTSYAGTAQVAWLRLTKGAYAPYSSADAETRSSDEFDAKYEMADSDTRISTSASTTDWTIRGNSSATITKSNGVLSVVPNSKQPYWQTTASAWKNGANDVSAFTIDFAIKINSCTITDGDRSFQFLAGTPNAKGILNIGMNHVYWQTTDSKASNIVLDSSSNSDKKHVFRISYEAHHGFSVWRDGVKIGEQLVDNTGWSTATFNFIRFGVTGSTVGGAFDIDYIRYDTTGAYDWKDLPNGLMILLR